MINLLCRVMIFVILLTVSFTSSAISIYSQLKPVPYMTVDGIRWVVCEKKICSSNVNEFDYFLAAVSPDQSGYRKIDRVEASGTGTPERIMFLEIGVMYSLSVSAKFRRMGHVFVCKLNSGEIISSEDFEELQKAVKVRNNR